jgi:hypothetical protein
MFGASWAIIRLQRPVDEVLSWLKRTPGAEEKRHGELPYVELMIAAMGPAKSCFCRVDDRTLLWVGGEGVFAKRIDRLAAKSESPAWYDAWKELEGGLFTAVAADVDYKGPPEPVVDDTEELTQEIFSKARLHAVGVDWQPNEGGIVSFKLRFRFDKEDDARTIEAGIRRGLERMIDDARDAMSNAEDNRKKVFTTAMIALLEQARIETRQTEIGWQIDVRITGPIDIESSL